ncbi:tRNA-dihydrouridine synthase [Lentisphaera profundi]|uniref:tRNA-dihydrouridine synthase n=1 Tax=Lentisphaera profundi TaxID=1658616 RepID=A0ABY7VV38_9BACT|nr:tRNA-dihydrouridine synthase [Lentisphaera profundi]WDE96609.1 tRNA-dihydrouridine synthase [Lentisphaera profundi]
MNNFWQDIKKPGISLAPMEDVTDTIFRQILLEVAQPKNLQVVFSEFISTDGLCHPIGHDKVVHRLIISDVEKKLLKEKNVKIVAQVWGKNPEKFAEAISKHIDPDIFDGVDINMGCPVPKIVKQGGCSALINTPDIAKDLVLAAKSATKLPVSVKTRTGISEHKTEEWISHLLEVEPAAITLHGRTQKQQSEGQASWEEIAKGARVRDQINPDIPFWGNGDVRSIEQAHQLCEEHKLDGAMIGRGVFHNPWIFNTDLLGDNIPEPEEKIALLWRHASLYSAYWGQDKNFLTLRRFFKIYAQGFPGANSFRSQIMVTKKLEEVQALLKSLDLHFD